MFFFFLLSAEDKTCKHVLGNQRSHKLYSLSKSQCVLARIWATMTWVLNVKIKCSGAAGNRVVCDTAIYNAWTIIVGDELPSLIPCIERRLWLCSLIWIQEYPDEAIHCWTIWVIHGSSWHATLYSPSSELPHTRLIWWISKGKFIHDWLRTRP